MPTERPDFDVCLTKAGRAFRFRQYLDSSGRWIAEGGDLGERRLESLTLDGLVAEVSKALVAGARDQM